MLAAAFYLLLKDDLHRLDLITIDVEFAGREADLRGMLLNLIWRTAPYFRKDQLALSRVGKHSPAHQVAITVYRQQQLPDRVVTRKQFIEALK
jgi:hypothetical protein